MTESYATNDLHERARAYFDRPSFSSPSFLGQDEIVFLDDSSGTKQASKINLSTNRISSLTTFTERLLHLDSSLASGKVVYGIDAGGNERQQIYVIPQTGADPIRLTHRDDAIHDPGPISPDGSYIVFRSNARDEATFDVLGVSTNGGDPEMWLQDAGQASPVAISPDCNRILIARLNTNLDGDLLLLEKGGAPRNITPHDDEQWLGAAKFDANGTSVFYLSNAGREFMSLRRLSLETGKVEEVFAADWDVELFAISPDETHIAIAINENGAHRMRIIDVAGTMCADVDLPPGVIDAFSWSPTGDRVAFGFSTVEHPSVIMGARLDGSCQTLAQAESVSPPTFSPELIHFESFDGREIPAFWFRPAGDGPFPVLVDIHGGPESQRTLNYSPSGPVIQYLTSLGMGVLSLNVRGSTGYGKSYSHLDDKGLRLDAVNDVAHAVEWLNQQPDVDGERLAVYGRSYGGFMTLASLVFHPDLWTAGVDVVGIANFVSFLERTGPWRRKHREAEYGELDVDRDMLEHISPLTHIENIRVPLMVCHGRNDPRVPLYEAEQVVEAVRAKGLDVLLRVYDDEGHALSKRKNEIDAFVTIGAFLQEHLQLPAPTPIT